MAVQPNVGGANEKKRKNPPTFRHLPKSTAQKLKKSWIEKKKLKSQWKTQKRREQLDSGWPKLRSPSNPSEMPEDAAVSPIDEDEDGTRQSRVQSAESSSSEEEDQIPGAEPTPKKPRLSGPSREKQYQSLSVKTKGKQPVRLKSKASGGRKVTDEDAQHEDTEIQPSLRDLTRRAYSRASLHTYKSNPLHRRKEAANASSKQFHSSKSTRSNARDRGGSSPRGQSTGGNARGGQPNMKLRMEAMLERIKKNYS